MKNILLRLCVAVVFIPLVTIFIIYGGLFFFIPLLITAIIASLEAFNISDRAFNLQKNKNTKLRYVIVIVSVYLVLLKIYIPELSFGILSFVFFILLIMEVVLAKPKNFFRRISTVLFPVVYISWGFSYLLFLRELRGIGENQHYILGAYLVSIVFAIAWMSDSFGMITGHLFGKKPLIPSVSPKKTIEGSIGCILGSVLGAIIIKLVQLYFNSGINFPWFFVLLAGTVGGVASQFGDLIESVIKRDAEEDESSTILPGHGGILDKFDSVIFSAFITYYLYLFIAG